ncbi:sugar nucleotide-binding protein [Blastococcus sp. SYSU DS0973]
MDRCGLDLPGTRATGGVGARPPSVDGGGPRDAASRRLPSIPAWRPVSRRAERSSAPGIERHWLVRTTWVVGEGRNFVRTMAGLADRGISPSVVDDQTGRLALAADLAAGIGHVVGTGAPYGTYNLTNDGDPASWADVAALVFTARGRSAEDVTQVSTADYFAGRTGIAPGPLNSVLDLSKSAAAGVRIGDWRTRLTEYLQTRD